MEKFNIAKYGMMQVTAIAYGVLATGAATKLNKSWADMGYLMPDGYRYATLFRDYGSFLLLLVIGWVVVVSYMTYPYSRWNFEDKDLSGTGLGLAILLAVLGTFLAFAGAVPPEHLLMGKP